MNCYDRRLRRTVPVRGSSSNELVSPPQRSRVNGWSLPLHSFQFIAWVVYSYMAIVGFGIYIPLLPYNWKYAGYTVIGVAFVFHFVTHLVAVSIDPADPSIRAKKNYSNPMPVLDKRKHPHVIQNLHCYLCEVDVGPKVKHCSSCNKCISDFDHHCKWLNNCVGGRNYWFFFLTVVSAVFGVLLLVFVILFIFIEHFVNPAELRTAPQFNNIAENSTWLAFLPVAPIETSSVGILVVAFITFMLGVASLLLLGHLLGFHIYLLMKKMSTYEYIVKQRHTQSIRDQDIGATQSTTASGTSLENLPPVESAVDCDAPLSGRASALKYQDKVQVASRLSNGICTETGSFQSGPGDSFYYSPKSASQSLPASVGGENLSDSVGIRESTSEDKVGSAHPDSMEGAPIVQNPLGSTLMQATLAIQPGPADSPSGTTGSDLP